MVSPARPAPPVTWDTTSSRPPSATAEPRGNRLLVVLGLVALVAAIAFPFAPVQQPRVDYAWPPAGSTSSAALAIPLMPYQPVRLEASLSCAALRGLAGPVERTALSTVPRNPDPAAEPLNGLRATVRDGALRITTGAVDLAPVLLPAGDCAVTITSDPTRTAVLVDGVTVAERAGDVRPAVTGVFTDAPSADGLGVRLTADTRFQTTITPVKTAIAVVGVVALLAMLVLLARRERRAPTRLLPRAWWRPGGPDLVVGGVMALWWIVGPVTVDDGYISGIVRNRAGAGFVGNVYRWLNAPEAPFSWFYDLYFAWSRISPSTAWMRLPSVLLALLCWGVLSRLVVPRLLPRSGALGAGRRVRWLAALAALAWFLPFTVGLRPEPWVSLGLLLTVVAVERTVATRRLFPLVVGLLIAAVTTAVTPGGLMAFAPFLAAAVPVLRTLRARAPEIGRIALVVVVLAAPASAVFLMLSDQSLASMLEATRVRTLIGGGQPWYEEYTRYSLLLDPGDMQGSLAKRLPVLLGILAAVAVLWTTARRVPGIATGPARRIAVTFLLGLAAMTATPTKWTQHFGDLAGVGAAVLLLGLVGGSRAVLRARTRSGSPALIGLGALTVVGSLVLAGYNIWPYASNWWGLTWSDVPPLAAGIPVTTLWLGAGVVLLVVLLARLAWRASAGRAPDEPRWQPSPAMVGALLVAVVVALPVATFARTSVSHRDDYTLASDAVGTAFEDESCALQERLSVETDPAAGLLPEAAPSPASPPLRPVDVGGTELPGIEVSGDGRTAWYRLDPAQRDGSLPVVVTVDGALRPGDGLRAEFGGPDGNVVDARAVPASGTTPRDARLMAPGGAELVRLASSGRADAGEPGGAVASLPRVPRLTAMEALLPPGTDAILDWPVAFFFPCLDPAPFPPGTAGLPQWRVGPPQADGSAGITYDAGFGGPFVGPRLLVTERRMATYLDGDPTRDAAQVYRWTPVAPMTLATPTITEETRSGTAADGHARVPGLDAPGAQPS
ncbi:MAG: cell wall arabinan synthesis protein [Pseudonocardia sp.]|uniref:arabinosyltransferase domain-containing protein n=1 Tax=Pseudonocardia sp. TaxID=60912 RepID=UPI002623CFCD|nr:arabinosyltransferase domain-containing protein [Pseudonocardia sp.]MCU1627552.1 cell wall arabinan synthesis protein [Pseudonocardia sp.]